MLPFPYKEMFMQMRQCKKSGVAFPKFQQNFTSSSQVFLCDGDEGTHSWPFSRDDSRALRRALDRSCLTRWVFLEESQLTLDGDSDPVISTT